MLTVDQLIDLEVRIEEEIERISAEMEASGAEREAVAPDKAIGRLSRLDAIQMQELAKEAQRRREDRLTLLVMARERMDAGAYGTCQRCGGEIAWERLDAQPEAPACGACAG